MTVTELENDTWYVCEVTDVIQDTHMMWKFTALLGIQGFVKRNEHTKGYYQLLVRGVDNIIHGFYVKEEDAIKGLNVLHVSTVDPIRMWSDYFKGLRYDFGKL
jgi:hypothetical protein